MRVSLNKNSTVQNPDDTILFFTDFDTLCARSRTCADVITVPNIKDPEAFTDELDIEPVPFGAIRCAGLPFMFSLAIVPAGWILIVKLDTTVFPVTFFLRSRLVNWERKGSVFTEA